MLKEFLIFLKCYAIINFIQQKPRWWSMWSDNHPMTLPLHVCVCVLMKLGRSGRSGNWSGNIRNLARRCPSHRLVGWCRWDLDCQSTWTENLLLNLTVFSFNCYHFKSSFIKLTFIFVSIFSHFVRLCKTFRRKENIFHFH